MKSNITILADNKPLALFEDFSLSVELSNPLFSDMDMFSYPVSLPIDGNHHFLKNIGDVNADLRSMSLEHTPMQIIADGVPFIKGIAVIQEDEDIEDSLSLNIDASSQSFQDLIGDLKCNEVKIPKRYRDSLLIGEKIDNVNVQVKYKTDVTIKYSGKKNNKKFGSVGEGYTISSTCSPQALGFSYFAQCKEVGTRHKAVKKSTREYPNNIKVNIPEIKQSYINVSDPYPVKPFCNARVCYKHHDLAEDGTTSSNIVKNLPNTETDVMYEDHGPLWVLEADRPQSGICFYVLFFLDCLFEHLGVSFDNSALRSIGDFNRLCFFTTKCSYDTRPLYYGSLYSADDPEVKAGLKTTDDIKTGFFSAKANDEDEIKHLFDEVNEWLDSRGCGGTLSLENPKDKSVQQIKYYKVTYKVEYKEDPRFPNTTHMISDVVKVLDEEPTIEEIGKNGVIGITTNSSIMSANMNASIVRMYANEKNFPKESVSSVISSLENQFGIKFHYDYERKHVTAYLIRDIFRKQDNEPRPFHADIHAMFPIVEKITGVRVGYSAESNAKEQRNNVRDNVKDYNTDYDYIEYDKNYTVTSMAYRDILNQIHNNQLSVFVDTTTGNKYRVKVDSQFSNADDMNPRLFEVAAFKGVEFGDCSAVNEDFVLDFRSDFVPAGMMDVNYRKALSASFNKDFFTDKDVQPTSGSNIEGYMSVEVNAKDAQTVMATVLDEDMEHEFVKQYIKNPLSSTIADFYVTETLSLQESYNPSKTDDGNSPLQSLDWGLTVAIMRGGGADASTETFDLDYDGFGNSKWRTTAGEYALTIDSIDPYGNVYDYNGTAEGIGDEERFSLKPRSWVQPSWADAPLVIDNLLVKNRGYVDTFLIEYIYFILHRRKYRIRCTASVAQIVDLQNNWKKWWQIADRKCLINKLTTTISATHGLGEIELEVYSL